MTSLQRRVTRLAERFTPATEVDPRDRLQVLALQSLLPEELLIMRDIVLRDGQQGPFNDAEAMAMQHYRESLAVVSHEFSTHREKAVETRDSTARRNRDANAFRL